MFGRFFKWLICILIAGYQYILSPFTGNQCRFTPTCSEYMRGSVLKHGVIKGIFLGSRRISCCHPYYKGNYQDLVAETFEWKELFRYKQATKTTCCNNKAACDKAAQENTPIDSAE